MAVKSLAIKAFKTFAEISRITLKCFVMYKNVITTCRQFILFMAILR